MTSTPFIEEVTSHRVVVPFPTTSGQDSELAHELSTFFDVSLDMLCIRDLDGFIVMVSQSWETALGYSVEELIGTRVLDLVHPDDLPNTRISAETVEGKVTGGGIINFINRYRHKAGHYRRLEWRARRHGNRIYAVARDVTERIAMQEALVAAKEAAEAASRAKDDFLANMSHEIRTPLNGVIGIVDALGRTELSADQREMVGLIQTSGVTLERLVSDILDVSKIEAGKLDIETRPFDLDAALTPALDLMGAKAEAKEIGFHIERGPGARGAFIGDSTRIGQVLANLLSNAVKFTHQGEVRVRIGVSGQAARMAMLRLEVIDTGVGFDAGQGAHLFQRFSQADTTITRRFGGTGLGLSISLSLIEMMGGEIEAHSVPGQGSRFTVTLPLARVESLAAYDARRALDAANDGGETRLVDLSTRALRVLLAEDHPVNQRVVQMILASQGIAVVTVEDGAQALDAMAEGGFDLVLMDMQMPVMDGLTATRAIRDREVAAGTPRVPIVMLSANAMAVHRDQALGAGADLHVPKPITAQSLLTGIETAIAAMEAHHTVGRSIS